jgi:hypothetical protein
MLTNLKPGEAETILRNAQKRARQALETAAMEWHCRVERAASKIRNRPIRIACGHLDMLRLLRLKAWRDCYHVSLHFILTVLFNHFDHMPYNRGRTPTLGATIAVLTGPRAERLVAEEVARCFPMNEHITAERSARQVAALELGQSDTRAESFAEFVFGYRQRIDEARRQMVRNQERSAQTTRRHYRGNPWCE